NVRWRFPVNRDAPLKKASFQFGRLNTSKLTLVLVGSDQAALSAKQLLVAKCTSSDVMSQKARSRFDARRAILRAVPPSQTVRQCQSFPSLSAGVITSRRYPFLDIHR